jgi:ribonuclease HII
VANLNKLKKQGFKYICGVDEAGRGPLAGPMSVSFFVVSISQHDKILKPLLKQGLNDSKKLSEKKREELYKTLESNSRVGLLSNSMISAEQIDKHGIAKCMQILMKRLLARREKQEARSNEKTYFLVDGSIKFPKGYSSEVIIGGDGIEPTIMAASISAKVKRDRRMIKLAKKYPKYGFEIHKGYGTLAHRKAIKKYGKSREHRKSFIH